MTKQEIVDAVSEATGLTKVETETVMNGVMTTITESLARGERVELRGFGTFGTKQFQVGANASQTISHTFADVDGTSLLAGSDDDVAVGTLVSSGAAVRTYDSKLDDDVTY